MRGGPSLKGLDPVGGPAPRLIALEEVVGPLLKTMQDGENPDQRARRWWRLDWRRQNIRSSPGCERESQLADSDVTRDPSAELTVSLLRLSHGFKVSSVARSFIPWPQLLSGAWPIQLELCAEVPQHWLFVKQTRSWCAQPGERCRPSRARAPV